jgi:hypothetical protein
MDAAGNLQDAGAGMVHERNCNRKPGKAAPRRHRGTDRKGKTRRNAQQVTLITKERLVGSAALQEAGLGRKPGMFEKRRKGL